jgi:hypothetical protein
MRQPVLRDGIPERPDHVILPENIIKCLRSVLAGENLVLHGADGTRIAEAGNGELPASAGICQGTTRLTDGSRPPGSSGALRPAPVCR